MFWGTVLKEGQPYKVQPMLEEGEFSVLHLSNAILAPNGDGKAMVYIQQKSVGENVAQNDLKRLYIACLSEKNNQQSLDIYLNVS